METIKRVLKSFLPLVQIVLFALVIFLFVKVLFLEKEIEILQNNISKTVNLQQVNQIIYPEEKEILSIVSVSMEIVAVGVGIFTLFGGFLSLINVEQSKDLTETMKKAKRALRNQKELSANRFLQEGQLYRTWNRPHYARESYKLAIEQGKGTFSALVAEFTLISMRADRQIDKADKLACVEKDLESFIKKLQEGKHFYQGRRYLQADSYFTLACIYANSTLNATQKSEKMQYAEKASEMFQNAIRADYANPDIYRNYAAHLSAIDQMDKCKEQLQSARRCAKKDELLAEFMESNRLIDLFTLRGKRSEEEAEKILIDMDIIK